jgi:hypothetical protein
VLPKMAGSAQTHKSISFILEHSICISLQKDLNFTATLHKRKDGKWGPTLVLPNGTIEAHGIINSLTTGYAEMIVTRCVFFMLKRLSKGQLP